MDAAGLRAVQAQLDGPRRKAAHMAACSALKRCANNSQQLTVDMAGEPWWRDYVASQEVAEQMAAAGITGFTAQRMLYVKDPIYRSRTRVYFIVPVADGSQWRLHPGSMIKSAAVIPKHITAVPEGKTILQEHAETPASSAVQPVLLEPQLFPLSPQQCPQTPRTPSPVPARPSPEPAKLATRQLLHEAARSSSAGHRAPAPALSAHVQGSWTGTSLEMQQMVSALHEDVAKRTAEERKQNPFAIAEQGVITELELMTSTTSKRHRDEELGPAQGQERVSRRRKKDTRVATLQWLNDALALICGPRVLILRRGI